jgi:hypothetical protein
MSIEEFLNKLSKATLVSIMLRIVNEFSVVEYQIKQIKETFEKWNDKNKDQ